MQDKVWDTLKITIPVLIKNQQTPQKEFAATKINIQ